MNYDEWACTVPETFRNDPLWTVAAYRFALFLADLCWQDVTKFERERRTAGLCDQLYRAVGSIGANLAEGYSRSTGKERAHFYEYSLGSATRAAIGTIKAGTSWAKTSSSIVSVSSIRLSVFS